jgi:signal transduction histidine kinase/DNA-binding response OmpR family regulator
MPIRLRAIFVIVFTNLVIILFGFLFCTNYVTDKLEKSIETDMTIVANIADRFISAELEALKFKTADVTHYLTTYEQANWPKISSELASNHPQFIGITVMDNTGSIIFSTGKAPAGSGIFNNPSVQQAFRGRETISTSTVPTSGSMVFYIASPLKENTVVILTLAGTHFSDLVSTFTIWKSGHIFIDDSNGTVIANTSPEWVQGRFNFIQLAKTDRSYQDMAAVTEKALRGETGIGLFSVSGIPSICAYRPIKGSEEGWILGIIAPIPESSINDVKVGLFLAGLVSFGLSIIAAIIGSDVIKKPYEEIAALKIKAEESSNSKSTFLATMSHEMRTPLNAVIGLSELTLDGKISGEEKENIEKVYTAGMVLLGIINDILDISKIESGNFDLNPVVYDLPSLINDTITLNTMRIEEKPIKFKLFIEETLPSELCGDDLRIKQIFNNILSNAFKYTKSGTVEWHIAWEKFDADIWLVSKIKDTGIGIRKEDMGKLFQNYSQVDKKSHRKIEGAGLGLSLTKRMVEMMGGTIHVDSEYGKGTTFTVRIKQGYVNDIPIGPSIVEKLKNFQFIDEKYQQHARLVRLPLPYARVLVVDDVEPNLVVVKGILKPYGMQVDCVTSGKEAIMQIRKGIKYSAVFMDHMMPEIDGIETTRIIRTQIDNEISKTVPIIALTANAIRGNEEMFLKAGFQAFLTKPIDINQMDAVIRQWVRNKELEEARLQDGDKTMSENKTEQRTESGNTGSGNKKDIPGINLVQAMEQLGDDEEIFELTLQSFADNTPAVLDKLRNFDPEKISDYVITVHGMKGICRNICAEETAEMALNLEQAGKAGDIDFIKANNAALIAAVEKLLADIRVWLDKK